MVSAADRQERLCGLARHRRHERDHPLPRRRIHGGVRGLLDATLHRTWTNEVEHAFDNPRVVPGPDPAKDTPAEAARRAFLASDVGGGIDLFFGGGPYDFEREARVGHIVDSGVLARHPDWFTDDVIPRFYSGEEFWDRRGLWVGTVLSNYGILYSKESYARLGLKAPPRQWADLEDPRLLGEVALADPTKSSSMAKAFENVIQQQMQERLMDLMVAADRISALDEKATTAQAIHEGWIDGLRQVQLISANARYFTDSSQKVPIDVAAGDCAAGMCIDFYGRQQAEATQRRGGSDRLAFVTPAGGTVSSVDPDRAHARREEPRRGARRSSTGCCRRTRRSCGTSSPARRAGRCSTPCGACRCGATSMRGQDWQQYRSDPEVSPFEGKNQLIYHDEWTGGLFQELAFIVRVMCQDTQPELVDAWRADHRGGEAGRRRWPRCRTCRRSTTTRPAARSRRR